MAENAVPSFVGPFSISDDRREDTSDETCDSGMTNLSKFVNFMAKMSEVRTSGKYTTQEVTEHTQYVEDFVEYISVNVSKIKSIFRTKKHIRRGSHYEETKVAKMDEVDFLCVLKLTDGETMHVIDIDDTNCEYFGLKYGYIRFKADKFSQDELKVTTKENNLSVNIIHELKKAVDTVLKNSTKYKYQDEELDPIDESVKNAVGSCSMSSELHGPCIMLTLVTPHATTDIDMCFCVEKKTSDLGRCVMIPNMKDSCSCPLKHCHWIESVVEPANTNNVLSFRHKQVYICLKSLMLLISMSRIHPITLTSYILKMHILHHQQTCESATVGECFQEIVYQLLLLSTDQNDKQVSANGYHRNIFQSNSTNNRKFITSMTWRCYKNPRHKSHGQNDHTQNIGDDPNTIYMRIFEDRVECEITDLLVPAKNLRYTLELSDAMMFLTALQMAKYNAEEWWRFWPEAIVNNSTFSSYSTYIMGFLVYNKTQIVLIHDGGLKTKILVSMGVGATRKSVSYVTTRHLFALYDVCSSFNIFNVLRFGLVLMYYKVRQLFL